MKEPSPARQRTLALHDRALRFSTAVNTACPGRFSNVPSSACNLDHHQLMVERNLESEAGQLASIFAAIMLNMRLRLEEQAKKAARRK